MNATPVTVTDRAARRIAQILGAEVTPSVLRVSVEGGGCSGFQYRFDVARERTPDDFLFDIKLKRKSRGVSSHHRSTTRAAGIE